MLADLSHADNLLSRLSDLPRRIRREMRPLVHGIRMRNMHAELYGAYMRGKHRTDLLLLDERLRIQERLPNPVRRIMSCFNPPESSRIRKRLPVLGKRLWAGKHGDNTVQRIVLGNDSHESHGIRKLLLFVQQHRTVQFWNRHMPRVVLRDGSGEQLRARRLKSWSNAGNIDDILLYVLSSGLSLVDILRSRGNSTVRLPGADEHESVVFSHSPGHGKSNEFFGIIRPDKPLLRHGILLAGQGMGFFQPCLVVRFWPLLYHQSKTSDGKLLLESAEPVAWQSRRLQRCLRRLRRIVHIPKGVDV